MPVGAAVAAFERIQPEWLASEVRLGILSFGGGALLSAVALVLVPEGISNLSPVAVSVAFLMGGFCFLTLDVVLDRLESPMGNLVGMLSDFIPEALALGAAVAAGGNAVVLLAGLMALQNLPEGFNAFREMSVKSDTHNRTLLRAYTLLALAGPLCGLIGYFYLADKPVVVSTIMVFASGGILYIVFGDIAPQAKVSRQWLPPMGAVAGFLLGVIGQMMTTN
ncbi:MAG: divalent cation transporter [Planctomycetota bacterium]